MPPFGVLEIFYGLPWSQSDREAYASFLKEIGFQFYIYGPKADENLRRNWQLKPNAQELEHYRSVRDAFKKQGLSFGMALSPQGLFNNLSVLERTRLQDKVKILSDLGIDILGLFFDDMKSAPELADKQLEIVHLVQASSSAKIVFCPSYYCNDSLLDLFFGERPPGYLESLGSGLDSSIEVLWTGESIISPEISRDHLMDVGKILKRKPFICDNFFANDGPINSAYLRIQAPTGRPHNAFSEASAWAFNPMNQAHLSKIVLSAFAKFLKQNVTPGDALISTVRELCPGEMGEIILAKRNTFNDSGLDSLSDGEKAVLRKQLSAMAGPYAQEIRQWLDGVYAIGLEAVLEQSSFES